MGEMSLVGLIREISGRAYTLKGLRITIAKIRVKLLDAGKFCPEFGTTDIFEYLQHKGWLRKNNNNKQRQVIVSVPKIK